MRRSTLSLLLPILLVIGWCAASSRAAPRVQTQRFSVAGLRGPEQAIAVWAPPRDANERLPIVVAFHGKGESLLGPARGYAAWVDRYGVAAAYEALLRGELRKAAFGQLVRPDALLALNAELEARPFSGVLLVGVYTPDLLRADSDEIERYAAWVAEQLLPQVRRVFPFASELPRHAGVDGVSLGGMIALEVGLRFPEVFGSVGAIQPAVRGREDELAERADKARVVHQQQLRLLSSDADPLLPVTRELSRALREKRVGHQLAVYPGGHDYAFNRGPAAIELLHFHDAALRAMATR